MYRMRVFLAKRWILVMVFVVGVTVTAGLVLWQRHQQLREAADLMDRRALTVTEVVQRAVDAIARDTRSAAALFLASREVTESEFTVFVDSAGQHPGSSGLAYVAIVDGQDLGGFLEGAHFSSPDFDLFGFEADGTRYPSDPSEERIYAVRYYRGAEGAEQDLLGFDATSDPVWSETIDRAEQVGSLRFSRITQLFGAQGMSGFLAVVPVQKQGEVLGFTVSVAWLDRLISSALAESLREVIVWQIRDVTFGPELAASKDQLERRSTLQVGGRTWSLSVVPTDEARRELTDYGVLTTVVLGLLATVLAVIVTHQAIDSFKFRRETRELIRITEEKDEFLAAVSHALRTPMTVVLGMAEILAESTVGTGDDIREYVELLLGESRQLAHLVDDLLLSGRLDADSLAIRHELVDLRWEIERLVSDMPPPGGVDLTVEGDARAWVDPLRVRRILWHLYANAMHHGGSTVTIRIEEQSTCVVTHFVDDGPGVPEGSLGHLFESPTGKKLTAGGSATLGLGLRLSKRLAGVLGGDLTYRRSDDQTIFTLSLPAVPEVIETPEGDLTLSVRTED